MTRLCKDESGVTFDFDADRAVDGDAWMAACGLGSVKSCDFIWRETDQRVCFIEAKSSSPQGEGLGQFCSDLVDKLVNTMAAFLACHAGRRPNAGLVSALNGSDACRARWRFVVIVPAHEAAWLPPLRDAVRATMSRAAGLREVCDVEPDPLVLNEQMARRKGFLPSP